MASVFSHLFSCCFQRKPSSHFETPNEQSHLIPATTEQTSASMAEELVIDHQKLKERMSSIVRSKEGKMVNLNARLPFNLHNKKLAVTIDASSSGSRSASSHRRSLNFSPLSPASQSHEQIQGFVGAPLTPASHPALSRDSSMGSREPSGPESETSATRTPILNVRLVKKLPSSGTVGIAARRGRARRKGGESNNSFGLGIQSEESVPTHRGLPSSDTTVADNTPRMQALTLGTGEACESKPTLSVSPASTVDFVIHDTGPLIVSWGD